jgi:hypothetical protein
MINYLLIGCISAIRPLLGPASCRYSITCTPFAIETLKKEPLIKAIPIIFKRVISCHPFTK